MAFARFCSGTVAHP